MRRHYPNQYVIPNADIFSEALLVVLLGVYKQLVFVGYFEDIYAKYFSHIVYVTIDFWV